MSAAPIEIQVNLAERSYPIFVGREILAGFGPMLDRLSPGGRMVIVTDTTVARLHLKPLVQHLRQVSRDANTIVIPPGERQKNLSRAGKIFTELLRAHADRDAVVVALGGGVIGDLAGFVAATYKRGVRLVHVPTTLLAQVDSAVGGKVAVNHPMGKNMIGTFYQPVFVWVDGKYLETLPRRELVCGLGEIVKYAIAFDAELFSFLEENLEVVLRMEPDALIRVQSRCLRIKSRIVSQDERESGVRSLLNVGHTIGHGLESAGEYRLLKHGEAVLLGLIAESSIARDLGVLSNEAFLRIAKLVGRFHLRFDPQIFDTARIYRAMKIDKKTTGGNVRFAVPTAIGESAVVEGVDRQLVLSSLKLIRRTTSRGN